MQAAVANAHAQIPLPSTDLAQGGTQGVTFWGILANLQQQPPSPTEATAERGYQYNAVHALEHYLQQPLAVHSLRPPSDALESLVSLQELADSPLTPLETLLSYRALATVVFVVQRTSLPVEVRMAAWATALAFAKRLAGTAHCFRARVASADLRPLLDRALSVLEACNVRGMLATVSHAHLRKEVVSALQLLCCLGQGDVFFHSLLVQQCKVPATLERFAGAPLEGPLEGPLAGPPADMVQLAAKLQGAAARLREQLLNAH